MKKTIKLLISTCVFALFMQCASSSVSALESMFNYELYLEIQAAQKKKINEYRSQFNSIIEQGKESIRDALAIRDLDAALENKRKTVETIKNFTIQLCQNHPKDQPLIIKALKLVNKTTSSRREGLAFLCMAPEEQTSEPAWRPTQHGPRRTGPKEFPGEGRKLGKQ